MMRSQSARIVIMSIDVLYLCNGYCRGKVTLSSVERAFLGCLPLEIWKISDLADLPDSIVIVGFS